MGENKDKKSWKQAYFSWKGLGLFDLIPGIRDLPYLARLVLMIITVVIVVSVVILALFGFSVLMGS